MEKGGKVRYIPKTEYIDGALEFSFIPIDDFVVGISVFVVMLLYGLSLPGLPVAIAAAFGYRRFKKTQSKNFYLMIPYKMGFGRPKGVPPVTSQEFME